MNYGPHDGSEYRDRMEKVCGRFVDVIEDGDEEVIRFMEERKYHILFDIQGHTLGNRLQLITTLKHSSSSSSSHPPPVIVNYLIFPGSSGCEEVDFVIVDRHVVVSELAEDHFSEQLALLPDSYQINYYSNLDLDPPSFQKNHHDDNYVFCNFNKITKLDPSSIQVCVILLIC